MRYVIIILNADGEIVRAVKTIADLSFDESGAAENDVYETAAEILAETDGGARSVVVPLSLVTLSVTCALSAAKTASGRGGKAATLPHESGAAEKTAERKRAERNAARRMHNQTKAAREFSAQRIIFPDLQYLAADALRNAANAEAADAARAKFAELSAVAFKYHSFVNAAAKARKDLRNAEKRAEYYERRAAERRANGETAKAEADAARAKVWNAKADAAAISAEDNAAAAESMEVFNAAELSAFRVAAEIVTLPPFDYDNWLFTRGNATAAEKLAAERLAEYAARMEAEADAAAWTAESAAEYMRAKAAAEAAAERAERSPFERLRTDTADYLAECIKSAENAAARLAAERIATAAEKSGGSAAEAARKYRAARVRIAEAEAAKTAAEKRGAFIAAERIAERMEASKAYANAFERRAVQIMTERGAEFTAAEYMTIRAEVYAAANGYVKTWKRIRGAEVYTEYIDASASVSLAEAKERILNGESVTARSAAEAARKYRESGGADAERLAELAEAAEAEAERARRLASVLNAINAEAADAFSATERRVFSLMLNGYGRNAIAAKIGRSFDNVSRHIGKIRVFAARYIAENAAEFTASVNAAEAEAAERVIELNADAAARMRKYRERKRAEKKAAEARTLSASMLNAARVQTAEAARTEAARKKIRNAQAAERMRKYRERKAAAKENAAAALYAAEIERRTLAENAERAAAAEAARRVVAAKDAARNVTADGKIITFA